MHMLLVDIAKYLFIVVALLAFGYWLSVSKPEKIRLVWFGMVAGIVTYILVKIGGALYFDTRPFVAHHLTPLFPHGADNGFPSDHTALTAWLALVIFSSSKRIGLSLLAMSALIGLARVVGHIHAPIDIIGSLVFAAVGFAAASLLTPHLIKHTKVGHEHLSRH